MVSYFVSIVGTPSIFRELKMLSNFWSYLNDVDPSVDDPGKMVRRIDNVLSSLLPPRARNIVFSDLPDSDMKSWKKNTVMSWPSDKEREALSNANVEVVLPFCGHFMSYKDTATADGPIDNLITRTALDNHYIAMLAQINPDIDSRINSEIPVYSPVDKRLSLHEKRLRFLVLYGIPGIGKSCTLNLLAFYALYLKKTLVLHYGAHPDHFVILSPDGTYKVANLTELRSIVDARQKAVREKADREKSDAPFVSDFVYLMDPAQRETSSPHTNIHHLLPDVNIPMQRIVAASPASAATHIMKADIYTYLVIPTWRLGQLVSAMDFSAQLLNVGLDEITRRFDRFGGSMRIASITNPERYMRLVLRQETAIQDYTTSFALSQTVRSVVNKNLINKACEIERNVQLQALDESSDKKLSHLLITHRDTADGLVNDQIHEVPIEFIGGTDFHSSIFDAWRTSSLNVIPYLQILARSRKVGEVFEIGAHSHFKDAGRFQLMGYTLDLSKYTSASTDSSASASAPNNSPASASASNDSPASASASNNSPVSVSPASASNNSPASASASASNNSPVAASASASASHNSPVSASASAISEFYKSIGPKPEEPKEPKEPQPLKPEIDFSADSVPRVDFDRNYVPSHRLLCDVAHYIANNINDDGKHRKYTPTSRGCANIDAFAFSLDVDESQKKILRVYAFQVTRSKSGHPCEIAPWNRFHTTLSGLVSDKASDVSIEYHYIYILKKGIQPAASYKFPFNRSINKSSDAVEDKETFHNDAHVKSVSYAFVPDFAAKLIGDYDSPPREYLNLFAHKFPLF
jgi:hypothetical protein